MKVTIYSIPDCPFCKQAKDYLTAKNIAFDDKNVQVDKDALAHMQDISRNFHGVPFTVVIKDDGTEIMLKGFTQSEFDTAFATQSAPAAPEVATPTPEVAAVPQAQTSEPAMPATPAAPVAPDPVAAKPAGMGMPAVDSTPADVTPPASPASTSTEVPADPQGELDGLLRDLQTKVVDAVPAATSPTPSPTVQATPPANPAATTVGTPPAAPAIPDFPKTS